MTDDNISLKEEMARLTERLSEMNSPKVVPRKQEVNVETKELERPPSLRDSMNELNKNFEELVKKKRTRKFGIPWKSRVSKLSAREGYASICYINENRGIKFIKAPIKEGAIIIDGIPHLATTDYMLTYKNKPFLIVPSWNTEPFAPEENLSEAARNKRTTYGYRLLLNTLKSEQLETKKSISGMTIFILIAAIVAIGYYFTRGGL